jgi:spore maturation protein SpmA
MVLNYIWIGFFVVAFVVAIMRVAGYYLHAQYDMLSGIAFDIADRDVFSAMLKSTFDIAETSVTISIYLIGIMTLWLGIMKIGEKGGAVHVLSRLTAPFFTRIFPEVPRNHPAMGSMLMNFTANMLGLDNAATPLGLKAMNQLQELNNEKDTASNAQIMFLVLNTSGLTLIPVSIMGLRAAERAANPADIFYRYC